MKIFYGNILTVLIAVLISFNTYAQNIKEVQKNINILLSQNNFDAAVQLLNDIAIKYPDNDTLITMQGLLFFNNQNYEKAEELFEKALRLNHNNTTTKFYLAETYTIKKDFHKAKVLFSELLNNFPNQSIILDYLGQIAIAENDYPSVKKYFTHLIETDSTNIDALNTLGVLALVNGKIQEAEYLLLKSILYSKNNINAYYNLGVLYLLKEDYIKALVYLDEALKIDSTDVKSLFTQGLVYLGIGQREKSETFFEKSLKYNPNLIDALIGLYIVKQQRGERIAAFELIQQIEKIFPNYEPINLLKADYYYSVHDISKAIFYTELEMENNPNITEGYYILSMLYSQIGDENRAKEYIEIAKQISTGKKAVNLSFLNYLKIAADSKSEIIH